MNLDGDDAGFIDARIGLGVVDGLNAVDPLCDLLAVSFDFVFVPVVTLQDFVDLSDIRLGEDFVAARLIIEATPPFGIAHVGLVTADFVVIWNSFGAKLNAGVGSFTDEFEFQGEDEIGVVARGAEEFVARDFFLHGAADNGAILDAEGFIGIPFPAFEGFAIEKRDGFAVLVPGG